jgi:transcription elongation factor/antiterminator RfaH
MDGLSRGVAAVIDVAFGDGRCQCAGQEFAARSSSDLDPLLTERDPSQPIVGVRWYVAYSQPHREFRAQTQLAAQGFRTFLPRYRKTVRHARKLMTVDAPFFSRYLFVAFDLRRDQWRSVNGTFGVTSLLSDGMFPIPLPQGVIESLINCSDASGYIDLGDALQVGERVRILTGPFADLVGELVRLDGARRVQVLLQLLNGVVAVSIEGLTATSTSLSGVRRRSVDSPKVR